MNEQENFEQQQQAANGATVTPPPFRPSEEPLEAQEQAPSPTLADRVAAMGLDDEASQRLVQLTEGIGNDQVINTNSETITLSASLLHNGTAISVSGNGVTFRWYKFGEPATTLGTS